MPTNPYRTPPPGTPTEGTAIPLPPQYLALNTAADPQAGIKQYVDDYYQQTGHLPQGFTVKNGHAVEQEPGFLLRHPWLIPIIGVAVGLTGGAIAGTLPGMAGGATAAGAASTVGPSTAANIAATSAAASSAPAGIAATTAPVVSKGLTSWLTSPLVDTGIRAGTTLLGAKLESNASRDAALIQQESFNKALDWEKSQYADLTGRLAPYLAAGTSASDRQAQLLGLPARPGTTATSFGPNAYALGPRGDDTRSVDTGTAPQTFYAAMKASGLDPVAVQGHGKVIADAVNRYAPGANVTVDPKTDAVVWPGIGPVDVTVDSGKGGWSFRPSGGPGAVVPAGMTSPVTPTNQFSTQPQARTTTAPAGGTVLLRAPTGQTQAVPPDQVAHYLQMGAVRA